MTRIFNYYQIPMTTATRKRTIGSRAKEQYNYGKFDRSEVCTTMTIKNYVDQFDTCDNS